MKALRNVSLFEGLTDEQLELLGKEVTRHEYKKNAAVIKEGDQSDSLFVIEAGKVKVFFSDEKGREFVLTTLEKDAYFGEFALLDGEERSASVTTVEPSTMLCISRNSFSQILRDNPDIAMNLIGVLVRRIRSLAGNVKMLGLKDVYGRIVELFDRLAEPTGEDEERAIPDRLTQQEIANRIGSSREMVARILKELTGGGFVELEDKRIVLKKALPKSF